MTEEKENIEFDFKFLKKINIEILILIIFAGAMLVMLSIFSDDRLVHNSPYQYVAGDMFFLLSGADWISDSGDVTRYPSYLADGADNQFPGLLPLFPMAVATLSDFTKIEKYDILFHLNIFFTVMMILGIYLLLRKINNYIAILGLPVLLIIFRWPFNYNITWGMQATNMCFFFIITAAIVFIFMNLPWIFVIFGILNAGSFFSHMRELLTLGIGLGLYFLLTIRNKFDWIRFKGMFFSFIVSGGIISYYLPILWQLVRANGGQSFLLTYCPAGTHLSHFVLLKDIGFFEWLFFLGLILVVVTIIIKKDIKKEYLWMSAFGFACIFTSFFCVIGNKTSHMRNFLPFFAAFFIAILLTNIFSILPKMKKFLVYGMFILFLILIITNYFPKEVPEYAVSNPFTWNSFKWIQDNTKDGVNVLTLYGDNFYQYTLFFSMKRRVHEVDRNEYIKKIQEKILTPILPAHPRFLGKKLIREGNELRDTSYWDLINVSICDYDYIYSNKISRIGPIQEYTQLMIDTLIKEANFGIAYNNELVVILKNNNVNGTCFKERSL